MKKVLDKKLVHRFVDLIDETSDSQTDQLTFSFSSETPVNRGHYPVNTIGKSSNSSYIN